MKNRNTTGTCAKAVWWRTESTDRSLLFSQLLSWFSASSQGLCAYHQCQPWHSSAHTRLGKFRDNSPSGSVPTGRCCVWATDSLKVSSLKIILSGVVLLTAAVGWQPLSLQLQGPELNEFPIKNGLCISKDMPTADAASPCSLSQGCIHPGTLNNNSKTTRQRIEREIWQHHSFQEVKNSLWIQNLGISGKIWRYSEVKMCKVN